MPWIPEKDAFRRVREAAGYSVYTLSNRSGVSVRQLRKYESETPPGTIFADSLHALSIALKCAKEDLATWVPSRPTRAKRPRAPRGAGKKRVRLEEFVAVEREFRARNAQIDSIETPDGPVDLLTVEKYTECLTHYGAYEGHRFLLHGLVHDHKPLPDDAAKTLDVATGVGARFQVSRLVAFELPHFTVTVTTMTAEHTRRLLDRLRVQYEPTALLARVHVSRPKAKWRGFVPLEAPSTPLPFALVVERILSGHLDLNERRFVPSARGDAD